MSTEIEPHITKKYEIKKRLGKGVSILYFGQINGVSFSLIRNCERISNECCRNESPDVLILDFSDFDVCNPHQSFGSVSNVFLSTDQSHMNLEKY